MNHLITILLAVCSLTGYQSIGQTINLKGEVGFKIAAPAKQITAKSSDFILKLDTGTGQVIFSVPVRSFGFGNNFLSDTLNSKLKERFNNYYMESNLYPAITFSADIPEIKHGKNGRYIKQGKGILTAHGIRRAIDFSYEIAIQNKQITVHATTVFAPVYFNIRIPAYINGFYFKTVEIELQADNKK